MNKNLWLFIFSLIGISGLSFLYVRKIWISGHIRRVNFHIHGHLENSDINQLKKEIAPLVNDIISREIGLASSAGINFFIPKKNQRLTLYYLDQVVPDAEPIILAQMSRLVERQKRELGLSDIFLKPELHLFGDDADQLVLMVIDQKNSLSLLNEQIKQVMHEADADYKEKNREDLYAIARSERYPYMPHITLGSIDWQEIKNHLKDKKSFAAVWQAIQRKILEGLAPFIQKFFEDKKIKIDFVDVGVIHLAPHD